MFAIITMPRLGKVVRIERNDLYGKHGMHRLFTFLLFTMASGCSLVFAETLTFALVAKSTSDPNFVLAWEACHRAAQRDGNRCELLGEAGVANAHLQAKAIEDALASQKYAALAVSVTQSEFVASALAQANIPVVTFDSPFNDTEFDAAPTYVGVNNYLFGRDLGMMAQWLRPHAGTLCIMSVEHDPNLQQRVEGIRRALSGDPERSSDLPLDSEQGWTEADRCPLLSAGSSADALTQLRGILQNIRPDVLISVGHWPVINERGFRTLLEENNLRTGTSGPGIIVGVGGITSSYRELLTEGLLSGIVSIDFDEIGAKTYQQMNAIVKGKSVEPSVYTNSIFIPPQARAHPDE